jgi:hypothetical protein
MIECGIKLIFGASFCGEHILEVEHSWAVIQMHCGDSE